jgi:hypothetical protein
MGTKFSKDLGTVFLPETANTIGEGVTLEARRPKILNS